MEDDCTSCLGGYRHDHRDHGGTCPHAYSSGEPRSCCIDVMAQEVGIRAALWESRRGRGPNSPRPLTDPIGYAWFGDGEVS